MASVQLWFRVLTEAVMKLWIDYFNFNISFGYKSGYKHQPNWHSAWPYNRHHHKPDLAVGSTTASFGLFATRVPTGTLAVSNSTDIDHYINRRSRCRGEQSCFLFGRSWRTSTLTEVSHGVPSLSPEKMPVWTLTLGPGRFLLYLCSFYSLLFL